MLSEKCNKTEHSVTCVKISELIARLLYACFRVSKQFSLFAKAKIELRNENRLKKLPNAPFCFT